MMRKRAEDNSSRSTDLFRDLGSGVRNWRLEVRGWRVESNPSSDT